MPSKRSFSLFGLSLSILDFILLGLIAGILLLQLHLQFVQKINWDEFFYLSHIYDAQSGRLDKTLQMGHVHLFGWVTNIPGGEITQITAGRVVMWLAQLGTLVLIVKTALRFMPLTSALFAALCFLGIGFVFIHGTSFRADPIAALCMMSAVYVFAASKLRRRDLAALAVSMALGALISIKVILFAPLLAVLALWRLREAEDTKLLFVKFGATVVGAVLLFTLGLFLHISTLQDSETVNSTSSLSSTAETVFLSGGLFPQMGIMKVGFFTGFVPSLLTMFGLLVAICSLVKNKNNRHIDIIVLAMALPLLSFIFYRNAYPYFYAFIFPSAVILTGYAVHKLKLSKFIFLLLSILMIFSTAALYKGRLDGTRNVQTETIASVHQVFPEPVHYFDRNGMVSSFPKVGFFLSGWGMQSYSQKAELRFLREMEKQVVPLVIDNSPIIAAALRGEESGLLAKDEAALKGNYIHHWGYIWVAGKTLELTSAASSFSVLIPGAYTVESEDAVTINGDTYERGTFVNLERGSHKIISENPQQITLRWGENLYRPSNQASKTPIFGAF